MVRKNDAMRRFNVSVDELYKAPKITDILKSSFKTTKAAIEALRFSNETAAIEFFMVYDEIPVGDRAYIPIEAVCVKAAVSPSALLGATFMACKDMRGKESALIAVNSHPDVLKNTIRFAALPGGDRDRKMLHEAVGFLPTPKGGMVNVNVMGGQPQYLQPEKPHLGDGSEEEDLNELFPSVMQNQEKWADNRRSLLADRT